MKNNTLSVKKLMKNLILRTLRQLYVVSEIIILIRWVTPPQKVENLQFEFFLSFWNSSVFQILQLCKIFTVSVVFSSLAIYIYMSLCPLQHSLIVNSSSWFFFLLSECDRTLPLYAILNPICSQILHMRSIWNSFKIFTVSLSAEEFANRTFNLSYPNFRLCLSNRSASHEILIYSPTI